MMFYDVPMNQSVSTEDSRGLTSYSNRVRVTARWRKDTGKDTLSLGRTRHSVCNAVDVKGNFLGTHS
jgi:hypothetical protein